MDAYRKASPPLAPLHDAVDELVDATVAHWRKGMRIFTAGAVLAGALGVALLAAEPAPTAENVGRGPSALALAVLFAGIALLSRALVRKYAPTHPVMRALREAPEEVSEISESVAQASARVVRHRFLRVKVRTNEALSFRTEETAHYARILARYCSKARVTVPGVDGRAS